MAKALRRGTLRVPPYKLVDMGLYAYDVNGTAVPKDEAAASFKTRDTNAAAQRTNAANQAMLVTKRKLQEQQRAEGAEAQVEGTPDTDVSSVRGTYQGASSGRSRARGRVGIRLT